MSIEKSHFRNEYTNIIEEVNMHARNEFVQRYVDIPAVPLIRMQVLFLFLHEQGVSVEEIKRYIIPTIMVQIGLDCHQVVTLLRCQTEQETRTRQLTVLAGDYFSSKYYQLLARIGKVPLIRALARSIYLINERKTELYTSQGLSTTQKLEMQIDIDSALYTSFIHHFTPEERNQINMWETIMKQFIHVERLTDDLMTYRLGNIEKGYLSELSREQPSMESAQIIQKQIEQLLNHVRAVSMGIKQSIIKEEVSFMIQEYLQKVSNKIIV